MTTDALTPMTAEALASPNIRHGFFTRAGGVSQGIYASLNCGLGSMDDTGAVLENRIRVSAHLTGRKSAPLTAFQAHTARAVIVDSPWPGEPPEADALVTNTPGLVLGALAADCAPVLLADARAGVIAAAHAGWRGAISGIVDSAVAAMETLGAKRADIHAVIGPCIAQPSYEVGDDFEQRFLDEDGANAAFFIPGRTPDKRQFDLSAYVTARAQGLGLGEVMAIQADTYTDQARLFSYRRSQHQGEPDYARLISAIALT